MKKGSWRNLLALALALGMVLTLPHLSGAARAVDLDQKCTLTVQPGNPELAEDLAKADIVIDVYKVADAAAVPGIDTYSYTLTSDFQSLTIGEEMDTDTWRALAQEAAKLVFAEGSTILPLIVDQPVNVKFPDVTAGSGLDAGLYLIIARGRALGADYVTSVDGAAASPDVSGGSAVVPGDTGSGKLLATKAESNLYVYTFLPELVSLPTKEADENGVIKTSDDYGDWIYDAVVMLKPTWEPRTGSIEIVKGLEGFVIGQPATFVFQVDARDEKGDLVYSEVVSMNFSEAGEQSVQVDGIPVGAEITVTEVYSGRSYKLVSEEKQSTRIEVATDIPQVHFVNEPTDGGGGGAVTNEFEVVEDEEGNPKWEWHEIPDGQSGSDTGIESSGDQNESQDNQ